MHLEVSWVTLPHWAPSSPCSACVQLPRWPRRLPAVCSLTPLALQESREGHSPTIWGLGLGAGQMGGLSHRLWLDVQVWFLQQNPFIT